MKTHNHLLCGAAALKGGKRGVCRGGRSREAETTELGALLEGLEDEYKTLTL